MAARSAARRIPTPSCLRDAEQMTHITRRPRILTGCAIVDGMFRTPDEARDGLLRAGYHADPGTATTVYLAAALERALLVEGPAGVGKTELAKAVATCTGASLIRLQCYEGLDETRALYEWNYKKQLLRIQAGAAAGDAGWEQTHDDIFTEEFLLTRPLLAAIRR